MAGIRGLFVPGPSNVPESVRKAIDIPMEDHRAPDLPEFTHALFNDLKKVFKTENAQPMLFPGSGTGGWEAAILNTLRPGDKVLAARFGQFSHLWIDMCQRLGLDVEIVDAEWGEGIPVDMYRTILEADKQHGIKAGMNNTMLIDPEKPMVTSGIRLGTPACTTRGFSTAEVQQVGELMLTDLRSLAQYGSDGDNDAVERAVWEQVYALTSEFPIYR